MVVVILVSFCGINSISYGTKRLPNYNACVGVGIKLPRSPQGRWWVGVGRKKSKRYYDKDLIKR